MTLIQRGSFLAVLMFVPLCMMAQTVTTNGGATNAVPKFSSATTIVTSAITENNGRVGIGTTSPQRTLDVQGDINSHASLVLGLDNPQGATLFVNGPMIAQFQRSFLYGTAACCNLGNTGGSSLGSTAGASSFFNGAFFNSNGTADGDGVAGSQINTSLPSWRMALGSGSHEWPGGDNFAIGRVAAGGNYAAPTLLFQVDTVGKIHSAGGIVFPDGSLQTRAQVVGPQGPAGPQGSSRTSGTCRAGQHKCGLQLGIVGFS